MTTRIQVTIDIPIPIAILNVCPVNPLSRAKPLNMSQGVSSVGPTRSLDTHFVHLFDDPYSQTHVLAFTVVAARTLQNP
jgi:hypothetical protein